MTAQLAVIVLAAGQGTRMKSSRPKVLHSLAGRSLIGHVLATAGQLSPEHVIASMSYDHPLYDVAAVRAQRRLAQLSVGRTAYAGAYHGWGFHEDGARSGVAAAAALGVTW